MLKLKPEGILTNTKWVYDEETEKGSYVETDISNQLISWLLEPVELDPDLRLRDLFALLARNDAALVVFRRDWANEYVAEYVRVLDQAAPYTGEYDPEGIEYLELYRTWEIEDGNLIGPNRLDFHGVGYELQEDVKDGDYVTFQKGRRINWAIDFSPLADLLNLPLRLNPEIKVFENYKATGAEYKMPDALLADVIRGVLWELSFHGGPTEMAEASAELTRRTSEVKEAIESGDTSKFIPLEDVSRDLGGEDDRSTEA